MHTSRRRFISTTAGCIAAATLPGHSTSYAGNNRQSGDHELIVLSDGNLVLPKQFIVPDSIDQVESDSFFSDNNLNTPEYTPDCNLALWKKGDHLVLFDVGAGSNFMSSAGKVLEALEAIEIDPLKITDVVFTHAHPDHLWGLIDDFDELVFPAASYYMNSIEWEYWRDENTISRLPDSRKSFAVGATNRLAYLEDRINIFNYGDEVLSGVEAVDTRGHTPGHTSFALHQGVNSVLVLGDALTHPIISFQRPKWASGSDQDPTAAIDTRLSLLDRLAQDKLHILGYHLPHPGLGFVEKVGSEFRYVTG